MKRVFGRLCASILHQYSLKSGKRFVVAKRFLFSFAETRSAEEADARVGPAMGRGRWSVDVQSRMSLL
jgi:hypothetical protein